MMVMVGLGGLIDYFEGMMGCSTEFQLPIFRHGIRTNTKLVEILCF
jgi:hypothetical protein